MGYELNLERSATKGIRRVIVDEIDKTIAALAKPSRLQSIHEARKGIKRIRAALRLGREALGRRTFRRENPAFRDIGRQLSAIRDAEAIRQALARMKVVVDSAQLRAALAISARYAADRRRTIMTRDLESGRAVDQARDALRAARMRVEQWDLHGSGWSVLKCGMKRTYSEGQERFEVAYEHLSSDDFHAWRKRVKDLMFQVRLLCGLWPEVFDAWKRDLDALSELLGENHDLAMLRVTIRHELGERLAASDRDTLLAAIDRRQSALAVEAEPLGRILYAESPKTVVDRIGSYYKVSRGRKRPG